MGLRIPPGCAEGGRQARPRAGLASGRFVGLIFEGLVSSGVRLGVSSSGRRFGRFGARIAVIAVGVISAAFLLSLAASAQTEPLQITVVSTEGWPTVEATLTAFDRDGQPLTGLVQDDFSATLAGQPMQPTSLRTTSDPGLGVAVVLAFDVSGSMAGAPLDQARLAGRALIEQLGDDDQAAVVTFASTVQVAQQFTADRALLLVAIDGLGAGGNTALYDGVRQSAELVSTAPYSRSAIVLLSDGQDIGGLSVTTRQTSLDLARDSGALVFVVGLGSQIDEVYLSELAQAGNGQFLQAPLPGDLTEAYVSAGNILRQQYVLTLDASGLDFENETATLVIEANLAGALESTSASVAIPAVAIQPEPPAVTAPPPAVPVPVAVPQSEGGSTPLALIAVAAGAILVMAGGGLFVARRRARPTIDGRMPELPERRPAPVSFPEISRATDMTDARAWIQGPGDARVAVGETPVTIGYTADCTIVLPAGGAESQGRVRVWLRDGSYMLHNLNPRLGSVSVAGRSATWVVLDDGDEISIDGAHLVFRTDNRSS